MSTHGARAGAWPRLVVAIALAAVLTGLVPAVATATLPGRNGRIAFVEAQSGDCSIDASCGDDMYFVTLDGRRVHQVGSFYFTEPAFSPDGRRLAFVGPNRIGIGRVTTLSRRTPRTFHGPPVEVAWPRISASTPRWASDGRHIAFLSAVGTRATAVVRATWRGQSRHRVGGLIPADDGELVMDLSASGEIAYTEFEFLGGDDHGLFVMGGGPSAPRRLTGAFVSAPSWSPDGKRLVFARFGTARSRCGRLFTIGRHGRWLRRLAHPGCADAPVWSPDGKLVAYVGGRGRIFVMDVSGGPARELTRGYRGTWDLDWQPLRR